ncbi:thermonuclease family protein [Salinibacter altiplanensis]|uniref:thermonuclease family protein n=1 Tax=Salinibacter altiplanensis TaxID=1803181 RepID=UPI000C9FF0CA|nr:thermonuclease family protein [Salinibacter altiplanensis]
MPDSLTLRVVGVTDGDTFTAAGSGGDTITVRVWGIDAPESSQPYGNAATKVARELIGGELVRVYVQDTGPYGRHIARVQATHDGEEVGLAQSLAISGLAWHSRRYDTSKALMQHEKQARDEGVNVWSQANPTPPWDHRDAKGETDSLEVIGDGIGAARKGYRWARWLGQLFS